MLRTKENGNVYGFIGEGGLVTFSDLPESYGKIILKIRGKQSLEKSSFIYGQQSVTFVLSDEDIEKIGVGSWSYSVTTVSDTGSRSTFIPDLSTDERPLFIIEDL